eukprot:m.180267 g.180267  ORF g.180267 m.180267 type:complete len:120 (-) comp9990_c2_seq27:485-844(-)
MDVVLTTTTQEAGSSGVATFVYSVIEIAAHDNAADKLAQLTAYASELISMSPTCCVLGAVMIYARGRWDLEKVKLYGFFLETRQVVTADSGDRKIARVQLSTYVPQESLLPRVFAALIK